MSEFENKDLEQTPRQEPAGQPVPPAEDPPYEKPTPQLTLEPDLPPEPPVYEQAPHHPGSSAEPFQMPEPPRAPEPQPQTNYTAPPYQQQEPQYQPPQYQYQPPQYNQPQQPYYNYTPQYNTPPVGYAQKSRLAAGLLAILLGVFGVHNFYLGFNTRGTIQLIVSLAGGLITCGVATIAILVWAFIEGVMILSAQPSRMYDGNGVILRD